jgi:hypothetical protein
MCLLARTSSIKSAFLFLSFPGFREEPFFMGEDADTPAVGAGLPAMRPSHPTLMSDEKPLSLASQRLQEIVWIQSLHAARRLSFSAK